MIRLKVMPLTTRKLGLRKKQITFNYVKQVIYTKLCSLFHCAWSHHYPNKVIDGTMIVALYLKSVDWRNDRAAVSENACAPCAAAVLSVSVLIRCGAKLPQHVSD